MLSVDAVIWGEGVDRDIQSFSGSREGQGKKKCVGGGSYCSRIKKEKKKLGSSQ